MVSIQSCRCKHRRFLILSFQRNNFAGIEVLHFNPGRIRVYAPQVHHNAANTKWLVDYLNGMKEIKHFAVNPQTGSVLVEYWPEAVADNTFLRDLEELLISYR